MTSLPVAKKSNERKSFRPRQQRVTTMTSMKSSIRELVVACEPGPDSPEVKAKFNANLGIAKRRQVASERRRMAAEPYYQSDKSSSSDTTTTKIKKG